MSPLVMVLKTCSIHRCPLFWIVYKQFDYFISPSFTICLTFMLHNLWQRKDMHVFCKHELYNSYIFYVHMYTCEPAYLLIYSFVICCSNLYILIVLEKKSNSLWILLILLLMLWMPMILWLFTGENFLFIKTSSMYYLASVNKFVFSTGYMVLINWKRKRYFN